MKLTIIALLALVCIGCSSATTGPQSRVPEPRLLHVAPDHAAEQYTGVVRVAVFDIGGHDGCYAKLGVNLSPDYYRKHLDEIDQLDVYIVVIRISEYGGVPQSAIELSDSFLRPLSKTRRLILLVERATHVTALMLDDDMEMMFTPTGVLRVPSPAIVRPLNLRILLPQNRLRPLILEGIAARPFRRHIPAAELIEHGAASAIVEDVEDLLQKIGVSEWRDVAIEVRNRINEQQIEACRIEREYYMRELAYYRARDRWLRTEDQHDLLSARAALEEWAELRGHADLFPGIITWDEQFDSLIASEQVRLGITLEK